MGTLAKRTTQTPPGEPHQPKTMVLLLEADQPSDSLSGAMRAAQGLPEDIGVTPVTEKMLLRRDFPDWANQFFLMNDKTRQIGVIVPTAQPGSRLDGYVPLLRREIAIFHKLKALKGLYVCVPGAKDEFTATYLAPLTRQAAREGGADTLELSAYPSFQLALHDVLVDARVDKKGWKLVAADSEEIDEGPALNAIDGNPATYWHTRYDPTVARYPHSLTVDMGAGVRIDGFGYTPRQDGGVNGRVKGYEFYVSADGVEWGTPVSAGDLPNSAKPTRIHFAPVTARFFRFVAKSEQNGGPWATAAEIDVLRAPPSP